MVVEKPTCEMKVIDAKATAASTDHDPTEKGLSESVILRTRKMANYAWPGRSPLKKGWRSDGRSNVQIDDLSCV